MAIDPETEKRISNAVKSGEPYALDELMEEICGDDGELRREFSEIVADEYHRRLWEHEFAKGREAKLLNRIRRFLT